MTTMAQLEQRIDVLTECMRAFAGIGSNEQGVLLSADKKALLTERFSQMDAGNSYTQKQFDAKLKERGLL